MPREIDPRVTAKALRKLRRAEKVAQEAGLIEAWEEEFFSSVEERLETFGSAFHDPEKGPREDALSVRQQQVLARLRSEARKAKRGEEKGPKRSSFKPRSQKKAGFSPRVRQVEDDVAEIAAPQAGSDGNAAGPLPENVIAFPGRKR